MCNQQVVGSNPTAGSTPAAKAHTVGGLIAHSRDNLPKCLRLRQRYPIQIMALHHAQRGAAPELRGGPRGRPEMRIVHCREGVPHCILSPEPQVERRFRLAF